MKMLMRRYRHPALAWLAAGALLLVPPAAAQTAKDKARLPIVRDAEIESLITSYVKPLLAAAGLSRSGIQIVLVNEPSFNAFVSGRRIFVNTGAIMSSDTPNEITGVLAHEIGHLAGHHQERVREQLERAQTIAIVAGLLGAGVAAAGAATGNSQVARLGGGIFGSGGSVAMRSLFHYQRGEELTADRAALTYLRKTGQSPAGLLRSFENLMRNNMFSAAPTSAYISSHPLPQDRLSLLETAARESPYFNKTDDPKTQLLHDLARAKIAAYGGGAIEVRRLFNKDPRGLPARYGDAIATQLNGSPREALQKIDALVAGDPGLPWFHEVRGEILMEAGRADEAASAFAKAASLDGSGSGLLEAEVGQAMVTSGDKSKMKEAIARIRKGLRDDPANASAYRFLAMAYGAIGDVGGAELATAEGYWQGGAFTQARIFAARAQQKLKPGTPQWRQAQDILTTPVHKPD
ncbi:M48 family metalloprotease [Aurantimonas sp. MSK8Z-1]|uniref:M48 family metalloprotease n=1 Tax=Mangrovibrevibacter kandeliae TaxID=2968473 RepID=UPI002118CD9E|nr:M48 family metalloprotease [Aurantimonas sp. MSK8Z-1]MCW4114661.1 M48 family metalloprotease [Aurantimonas sp. MSK8Z-1]